jgi:hypothetical protein
LVSPVTDGLSTTVQLYVVPVTNELKLLLIVAPEQIVWLEGVAVTFGVGYTVINTVSVIPGQPANTVVGLTIYCAVNVLVVVLLNVIEGIVLPVPLCVRLPIPLPFNKLQLKDTFGVVDVILIGWLTPPLHNTCVDGPPTANATGWIV